MYYGFSLQNGRTSKPALILKEVMYFFTVTAVLVFATNAAQYTPFPTIDQQIINLEAQWNINISEIIAWTHSHPLLQKVLACTYDTLPLQMCFLPLIVIATMRFHLLSEYYFLLLVSCLLGFTFYYFFPTIAPASMIDSQYFHAEQLATGLKFKQIHHYIQPATLEGGMIAMPSFHAIWAWFCLYLLREWRIAFAVLLPVNLLLVASCVLLGWHYPLDLAGSLIIILIAHSAFYVCRKGFVGIKRECFSTISL